MVQKENPPTRGKFRAAFKKKKKTLLNDFLPRAKHDTVTNCNVKLSLWLVTYLWICVGLATFSAYKKLYQIRLRGRLGGQITVF